MLILINLKIIERGISMATMGNTDTARRKCMQLQGKAQQIQAQYVRVQQELMQWQNVYNNLNNSQYVNCNYNNKAVYARDYSRCESRIRALTNQMSQL